MSSLDGLERLIADDGETKAWEDAEARELQSEQIDELQKANQKFVEDFERFIQTNKELADKIVEYEIIIDLAKTWRQKIIGASYSNIGYFAETIHLINAIDRLNELEAKK